MRYGTAPWSAVAAMTLLQGCIQSPAPARGTHAAAEAATATTTTAPLTEAEVTDLLYSDQFANLERRFSAIQRDYSHGLVSDETLRNAFRAFYPMDATREAKYNAWVTQFPKSYVARLARGIYYKRIGLERRGGNFASDTSDEQMQGMESYFARASQDLRASLALDDKPLLSYAHAMDIAAFGGTQDERREILDHSLVIDPANFVVREKYLGYLAPRWGGSVVQMHAFLDECRKAQLSAVHLRSLEGLIVADEAATYRDAGDWAAAELSYRQAMALGRDDCLPCLAEVVIRQGKFADAIPLYSRMLLTNPGDIDTLKARALAYKTIGKFHEAVMDWTAAAQHGDLDSMNQILQLDKEMAAMAPARQPYPVAAPQVPQGR